MPVSSRGYFAMAKESAIGTEAPRGALVETNYPTYWAYPVEEVEFSPEKQFIDFQEIRGSRQAYTTLDGAFQPTAMIKGAVYPSTALAQFLYGAFGQAETAGTTSGIATPPTTTASYLYTFDTDSQETGNQQYDGVDDDPRIANETVFYDGNTLPSFTLERSDGQQGDAKIVEQLRGCKVESLQFTANFGEKVDMTVNFQATKKPKDLGASAARTKFENTTANDANNINRIIYPGQAESRDTNGFETYDISPLYFNRAALKIDNSNADNSSAVRMKTLSWEMTNTLARQETLRAGITNNVFSMEQVEDAYTMFEGGVECTLSGTAVFDSLDLYNKMLDGSTMYLELWLGSNTPADLGKTGANSTLGDAYHGLYFYWPKLKVSRASIPFTAGEVIESDVEFKVIYAPNAKIGSFANRGSAPLYDSSPLATGGSMFAKMISRMTSKSHTVGSETKNRPIFY